MGTQCKRVEDLDIKRICIVCCVPLNSHPQCEGGLHHPCWFSCALLAPVAVTYVMTQSQHYDRPLGWGFCSISADRTIVAFSVMYSRAELSAYAQNV